MKVQMSGKVDHNEIYDATNPLLDIADTAKKKSMIRNDKLLHATPSSNPYHHSRSHNEVSFKSLMQWQGLFKILRHRFKRSKRGVKLPVNESSNKTDQDKKTPGGKDGDAIKAANPTVTPTHSVKTKEVNDSRVLNGLKKQNVSKDGALKEDATPRTPMNASTVKPENCANQTDPAQLEIITKFR